MIADWVVVLTAFATICGLFALAHYGDTAGRRFVDGRARPWIYALTLSIYCSSWTFYGSVGLAATRGFDFVPIYLGPILMMAFGYRFLRRIVTIAKAQNSTSIADFTAARYGKSEAVGVVTAVIAWIGVTPYVALQLKAIATSLSTVLGQTQASGGAGWTPLFIALVLAGFAMAFGTRRIDAREHQDGLMLAVAVESVVKLLTFLAVGAFVVWGMFGGLGDLWRQAEAAPRLAAVFTRPPDVATWVSGIALSAFAVVLLPRQFHVMIVEHRDERDLAAARWLFPLYLVAINVFVAPLAIAGGLRLVGGAIDPDMTVLALPLQAHAGLIALVAMIGGFSAAAAMVVVASVALSIMLSNVIAVPALLRLQARFHARPWRHVGEHILTIRRLAILCLLLAAFAYNRVAGEAALASTGLLSFAAIAQVAPAFLGGLVWRRANARGALAGMLVGTLLWGVLLLAPALDPAMAGHALNAFAPRLHADLFLNGVFVSLAGNAAAFVVLSLTRPASAIERLQADVFIGASGVHATPTFRPGRFGVSAAQLEGAVARYHGADRTREAFRDFLERRTDGPVLGDEADLPLLRFAEHLLASAIGAPSSRLVITQILRGRAMSHRDALDLVDAASAAVQTDRDLLQHALDFARQGITVFDRDLRITCWNREFRELYHLPADFLHVGMPIVDILRYNALRGLYGPGPTEAFVEARLDGLTKEVVPVRLRLYPSDDVVEIRSARMPDGGVVTTYTDVTATVRAEEALEATNETLEQRVRERTDELVALNDALADAKHRADEANQSKTRFLAAASHDILQPLNAARLYAGALLERAPHGLADLAQNVDCSLDAVEEILTALLDISRLDAGATRAELSTFAIQDVLAQLRIEFAPIARERRLDLRFVDCALWVRSDRRLLRRLLQNLISNALKYTPRGRVVVGCRRTGGALRVEIWDTGLGIPDHQHAIVFREFERLECPSHAAPGLGLGLSIVERIAAVLDHPVTLVSRVDHGSMFGVTLPRAAAVQRAPAPAAGRVAWGAQALAGQLVLAIDNEPTILAGARALLEGWGCTPVTASGLGEACAALDAMGREPDVALVDYELGGIDGLATIAALRARPGADFTAVLVTADRSPAIRERAEAADIIVLYKPLKPAALRALMHQTRVTRGAAE